MARVSKAVSTVVKGGANHQQLATIDQELSGEVANIKNQISAPTGNRIKIDPKGVFILPDGTDLGNEIQIVVVDFYNRHFFYSQAYNPNAQTSPDCYAIGREINTLVPEADSPHVQHSDCRTCPMNAFGSGTNSIGKACQNRFWLAVLLLDPENPDAHNALDAPLYMLDLSPSNRKSFESAVATVARALNGPPIKAILTVSAENVGTYAKVTFFDPIANPHYATHFTRRAESLDLLTRKPDFAAMAARTPTPRGRAAAPARRNAAPKR